MTGPQRKKKIGGRGGEGGLTKREEEVNIVVKRKWKKK